MDVSELDTHFTNQELTRIFSSLDMSNQGVIKALTLGDPNIHKSIQLNTQNHKLVSDKLSERCYRIVNNYPPRYSDQCKWCSQQLPFYTFKQGYGNSSNNTCQQCVSNIVGISSQSQDFFWNVYNTTLTSCKFSSLNMEHIVNVTTEDKEYFDFSEHLNQNYYALDFVCGNNVIEYGADYWHKYPEKESMKQTFLEYKGYSILTIRYEEHMKNPEEVLKRCLEFLAS